MSSGSGIMPECAMQCGSLSVPNLYILRLAVAEGWKFSLADMSAFVLDQASCDVVAS